MLKKHRWNIFTRILRTYQQVSFLRQLALYRTVFEGTSSRRGSYLSSVPRGSRYGWALAEASGDGAPEPLEACRRRCGWHTEHPERCHHGCRLDERKSHLSAAEAAAAVFLFCIFCSYTVRNGRVRNNRTHETESEQQQTGQNTLHCQRQHLAHAARGVVAADWTARCVHHQHTDIYTYIMVGNVKTV